MPWLTYHLEASDTVRNAAVLVRAGARAVKLEGGRRRIPAVRAILDAEIPVMGHLGLTPQSIHAMGGYKVQGREAVEATELRRDAEPRWLRQDASPSCSRGCLMLSRSE